MSEAYENAKLVTVCLQIGNSDNKLTQQEWSGYAWRVDQVVTDFARERHFFGGPATTERWQNACWVFVMEQQRLEAFNRRLVAARVSYNQDSVALLVGDTQFI
jgi:hypothetical protein